MCNVFKPSLTACVLSIMFWVTYVHAAEEEILATFGDEEFVSIATGQQQPLADAPAVATVITAQQIDAMGATNLDQVLETVPGLHVSLSSLWFAPLYSMRGIHTDSNPQVLMLVNGTPLTQMLFGNRGTRASLPVSNIARVEVIRGPGSAVYGADAFAGVINVITKNREEIAGTELGARYGSFNTKELWLLNGSQIGELDFVFNINLFSSDGDDSREIDEDFQTLFDSIPPLGTAASLAPGSTATDYKRADIRLELSWRDWQFSIWNWRYETGTGAGMASALDPEGYAKVNDYLIDLAYSNGHSVEHWEFAAKLSYMNTSLRTRQVLFPPGTRLPLGEDGNINVPDGLSSGTTGKFTEGFIGEPNVFEEHTRFDFSTFYTALSRHTLRFAAGGVYEKLHGEEQKNFGPGVLEPELGEDTPVDGTLIDITGTTYTFIPDKARTNYYGSVQDQWAFATDWQLTIGLRYDYFSDFGSTVNPRAALVWHARQDLTTKLLYGRAFRAPSIGELYFANNPVSLGNPDLKPETINTYEVAFDYRPTLDLTTGLNLFYYQIDDLIEFSPDANEGTRTAQNNRGQTGHGFELEAGWQPLSSLIINGHYAYQKSEFDSPDEAVGRAPTHQLYTALEWQFLSDWYLSPRVKWIAGRKRDAGDSRDEIADYTITNMVLRRTNLFNSLDLSLILDNVFNVEAYEPSPTEATAAAGSLVPGDYPLSRRGIYLTASYHFRH